MSADQPMTFGELSATLEVLHDDRRDALVVQLDAAIQEAARRAVRHAGPASVTLRLGFKPEGGRVLLSASLASKYPEPASIPVPAYMTRDGRLVADDPDQIPLPLEGPRGIAKE